MLFFDHELTLGTTITMHSQKNVLQKLLTHVTNYLFYECKLVMGPSQMCFFEKSNLEFYWQIQAQMVWVATTEYFI